MFGGDSKSSPSTQANTTNNYTSSTNVHDIGLTGQNAVDLAHALGSSSEHIAGAGFEFASHSLDRTATMFERTVNAQQSSLNGLTVLFQDIGQRVVAGAAGQPVPIQQLGPAANINPEIGGDSMMKWLTLAAVGVGVLALFKD